MNYLHQHPFLMVAILVVVAMTATTFGFGVRPVRRRARH